MANNIPSKDITDKEARILSDSEDDFILNG